MSTNKTPNYALHSWLPTDEFHVSEINENFTLLDSAAHSLSQAVGGKADAAAMAAALSGLEQSKLSLVAGSYVGSNGSQRIELGVKPKAVLVMAYIGYVTSVNYFGLGIEGYTFGGAITVDATGFTVGNTGTNKNIFNIIENGVSYCYIALC